MESKTTWRGKRQASEYKNGSYLKRRQETSAPGGAVVGSDVTVMGDAGTLGVHRKSDNSYLFLEGPYPAAALKSLPPVEDFKANVTVVPYPERPRPTSFRVP